MKKLKLRPEVARFAQLMEAKLREHDEEKGKRGWQMANPQHLLQMMCAEMGELAESFMELTAEDQKAKWGPWLGHFLASRSLRAAAIALSEYKPNMGASPAQASEGTVGEAVDVANFAMFIVDVIGGLKKKK
jgi:hypothetical protein